VRGRFVDLVGRQLELFEAEYAGLLQDCQVALDAYNAASRDEAEERYADYLDLVETGTEHLAELRDNFASTMDEAAAEEYEAEFNRAVLGRLPRFAIEIEDV